MNIISKVYYFLFIRPLRSLYEYGPTLGTNFGFWGGQSNTRICATLTSYSEMFWQQNLHDCLLIVDNKFYAFQVTVESVLYFITLITALQVLFSFVRYRLLYQRPRPQMLYLQNYGYT